MHIGFANGEPLRWNGEGAVLCVAPPRAGKFTGFQAYNCLATGLSQSNKIFLSPKMEEGVVGFNQTAELRRSHFVSTTARYGLPMHTVNPVGHIHDLSPTLEDDIQVFCKDALPETGGQNKYFDLTAQRVVEGLSLTIAEWDGELTLPTLYDGVNLIMGDEGAWEHFAKHMRASRFDKARAVEGEIAKGLSSSSNGFYGVISEVQNALSAMSVSNVRRAFSPSYSLDLEEWVNTPNSNLYLGPEAEFIKSQKLIWRTLISTIATLKRRNPNAPPIDLYIDETVLFAPFPLIGELVNFAPSYGVRIIIITQSLRQLDQLFEHGREIITGGVSVQIYIGGGHDIDSARTLSEQLGSQTLYYNDTLKQSQAALQAKRANDAILRGADPFAAGAQIAHYEREARHRSQMSRRMMNPDEIINIAKNNGVIVGAGLEHPIWGQFPPYFEQWGLAGHFNPSPFFPPADRIKVKAMIGHKWRPVHRGAPPEGMEDYPQFQNHDHVWVG